LLANSIKQVTSQLAGLLAQLKSSSGLSVLDSVVVAVTSAR